MSYASTLAISRDRSQARPLIGGLLGFQAVLSLLSLALCLGLGWWLFGSPEHRSVWPVVSWLSIDLVLKAAKSTLRWLLKSLERFDVEAVSLLVERGLILVLGLLSLRAGNGAAAFAAVFVAVRIVDATGLWAFVNARVLPLRPTVNRELWLDLLLRGFPFAYAGVMITLFFQVDAVLIERMRGPQEVGWYSAPVRVLEGLTLVSRILGYALIPTMAALHVRSPTAVTELYKRGSKYLLAAGLPVAAFGALASGPFILMLFGAAYEPSVEASRYLIPAAAFMFLSNFTETTLACVNRWGTIVVASTVSLLLNVALNLIWIPRHGYVGAAWATLATEAAYFLIGAAALARYDHRIPWASVALRPALATVVFAAVLWIGRGLGLIAASAAASAVYVATTFAFGVWDSRERELMRGLLRGSRPDLGRLTSA